MERLGILAFTSLMAVYNFWSFLRSVPTKRKKQEREVFVNGINDKLAADISMIPKAQSESVIKIAIKLCCVLTAVGSMMLHLLPVLYSVQWCKNQIMFICAGILFLAEIFMLVTEVCTILKIPYVSDLEAYTRKIDSDRVYIVFDTLKSLLATIYWIMIFLLLFA